MTTRLARATSARICYLFEPHGALAPSATYYVLLVVQQRDLWGVAEVVDANKERLKTNRESKLSEMATADAEHEAAAT